MAAAAGATHRSRSAGSTRSSGCATARSRRSAPGERTPAFMREDRRSGSRLRSDGGSVQHKLRRALNAVLPADVWVAAAIEMRDDFHARYSAVSRRYSYYVGTDEEARSPFRGRYELAFAAALGPGRALMRRPPSRAGRPLLSRLRRPGHGARARRPPLPHQSRARGSDRRAGCVFEIEANRFLASHGAISRRHDARRRLRPAAGERSSRRCSGRPTTRGLAARAGARALPRRVTYPRELYADVE